MASDRHGKHNTATIAFRVNSYEKATIEERVKASGMKKQDYIVRSCIYNHVCVVGKRENIEILRSEMKEMNLVLEDVATDLQSEKPTNLRRGIGQYDGTISGVSGCNIMDAERFQLFMGGQREWKRK